MTWEYVVGVVKQTNHHACDFLIPTRYTRALKRLSRLERMLNTHGGLLFRVKEWEVLVGDA